MRGIKTLDLKLGFSCNNNCRFCVVGDKRRFGDKSQDEIKKELLESHNQGFSRVCFTGGEITIRKDIIDIVSYAKEVGYKIIMMQSNGRRFSSERFSRKIIQAGANQFGLSLHGHLPKLHDFLTRKKDSFYETVEGIKNLKKLNQSVAINVVVNSYNYSFLPQIASFLIKLGVDQYQLAFIHANGKALENFDKFVPRMTDTIAYLHKAIDYGLSSQVAVYTEAYPYCLMRNYEFCIAENYLPTKTIIKEYGKTHEFDKLRQNVAKLKFPQCKRCDYNNKCEGTWREYPERFGNDEFKPIKNNLRKRLGSFTIQSR